MPHGHSDDEENGADAADNLAIIDKIYAIACDPALYEDLIDTWSRKLNENSSGEPKVTELLRAHVARATALLERLSPIDARNDLEKLVADVKRPALACLNSGRVLHVNDAFAARSRTSVRTIADLDLSEASVALVSGHLRGSGIGQHLLLQLETKNGQPLSASLSRAGRAFGETVFLVVFYDFVWNSMLETVLVEAFGLTASERAVAQGFAAGLSTTQIARQRGRSEETVRTQLKTIMAKTGTRSQLELLRLLFGFTSLAEYSAPASSFGGGEEGPASDGPAFAGATEFVAGSGRRYDVHVSGAVSRHLCLHLHSSMGFYLLSDRAQLVAGERGLQLWSVIRPGYGRSGPLPARAEYREAVAGDLMELVASSGAETVSLLVEGVSFPLGLDMARRLGNRCRSIASVSPIVRTSALEPDRHDQKWHRIVLQTAARSPTLLPFFVRAGFAYARALGPFRFLEEIYGKSPLDLQALEDPSFVPLLQAASRITLSEGARTHEAFTSGLLLAVDDWIGELSDVACPVVIYYGSGDHSFATRHAERLRALNPAMIETVEFTDAGHLAIFTHGHRVIADIAARDG